MFCGEILQVTFLMTLSLFKLKLRLYLTSKFGHDGFLLENAQLTEIIKPLLP